MYRGLRIYTCPFSAIAVTAAQDLFEVNSASGKLTAIMKVKLAQYSDAGDAQDENLSLLWVLAASTSGSGGGTITPVAAPGDAAFSGTVERNNTTQATGGTPVTNGAEGWNVRQGYIWSPDPTEWIWIPSGGRAALQQTAPADSLTMNGWLTIGELG